jgi:hypothetical protein
MMEIRNYENDNTSVCFKSLNSVTVERYLTVLIMNSDAHGPHSSQVTIKTYFSFQIKRAKKKRPQKYSICDTKHM